ncbi:unnamed protein product [Chondrus crispus]|uniref:GATA-type domain-containing protein n=3 Tax=Chondrus crispus TaxID=2769 RepID=R7Q279_CHOCR|nr:unnamed protein product [Chondrus crispus]CDF32702.1 unnamed protein product [Chondrus crispus]|eukprot:XP_005712473.1 unnamed protein product [Chondrus crispus]
MFPTASPQTPFFPIGCPTEPPPIGCPTEPPPNSLDASVTRFTPPATKPLTPPPACKGRSKRKPKGIIRFLPDGTPWTCARCKTIITPVRRSGSGGVATLCNACGLRRSKNIRAALEGGISKKRGKKGPNAKVKSNERKAVAQKKTVKKAVALQQHRQDVPVANNTKQPGRFVHHGNDQHPNQNTPALQEQQPARVSQAAGRVHYVIKEEQCATVEQTAYGIAQHQPPAHWEAQYQPPYGSPEEQSPASDTSYETYAVKDHSIPVEYLPVTAQHQERVYGEAIQEELAAAVGWEAQNKCVPWPVAGGYAPDGHITEGEGGNLQGNENGVSHLFGSMTLHANVMRTQEMQGEHEGTLGDRYEDQVCSPALPLSMSTESDEVLAAIACGMEGASHMTDAPSPLPSASEPMAAGLQRCLQSIAGRIASQELMLHRLNEVQFQLLADGNIGDAVSQARREIAGLRDYGRDTIEVMRGFATALLGGRE